MSKITKSARRRRKQKRHKERLAQQAFDKEFRLWELQQQPKPVAPSVKIVPVKRTRGHISIRSILSKIVYLLLAYMGYLFLIGVSVCVVVWFKRK